MSGTVAVVGDDHLIDVPGNEPGLFRGQGRTQGGHGVVKARLVHTHHVHIALAENDVAQLGFLGQVHTEEVPAFIEHRSLGAVHIFRLTVAQDAAGKADDVAPHIEHREHQTAAERVVHASFFALAHQARLEQQPLGVALGFHGVHETVPGIRRVAQAELFHRGGGQFPAQGVVLSGGAGGGAELVIEKPGRVLIHGQKLFPAAGLGVVAFLLRHLHPHPTGEELHRLREGQVLDLHDEIDDAAALAAAEAVIDLLVRRHGERRGLFAVERTQAEQVRAAFFGQAHIGGDHIDNIIAVGKLL